MEKLLDLLSFPSVSIVSPLLGLVAGVGLALKRASVRASILILAAAAFVVFLVCSIIEGVDTPSVTIPGPIFGLLAVPTFVVPAVIAKLAASRCVRDR
jgi:hypothetical protein